ncbi:MAG TPA: hypothetical protein VHS76_13430 [Steroidobacteraceae bacterium]|nr:hypothetical protein [Steroidobacteraceae bacterium]
MFTPLFWLDLGITRQLAQDQIERAKKTIHIEAAINRYFPDLTMMKK